MFEGGVLSLDLSRRWRAGGDSIRSGKLRGERGDHAPRAAAGRHTSRRRLWNVKTTTPYYELRLVAALVFSHFWFPVFLLVCAVPWGVSLFCSGITRSCCEVLVVTLFFLCWWFTSVLWIAIGPCNIVNGIRGIRTPHLVSRDRKMK